MSFVSKKKVTLSRGFHFSKDYLAKTQADYDEYFFSFGIVEEGTKNTETRLDLEVIRRKYSNILDILTYDDLLRRLKNTLTILEQGET